MEEIGQGKTDLQKGVGFEQNGYIVDNGVA